MANYLNFKLSTDVEKNLKTTLILMRQELSLRLLCKVTIRLNNAVGFSYDFDAHQII